MVLVIGYAIYRLEFSVGYNPLRYLGVARSPSSSVSDSQAAGFTIARFIGSLATTDLIEVLIL